MRRIYIIILLFLAPVLAQARIDARYANQDISSYLAQAKDINPKALNVAITALNCAKAKFKGEVKNNIVTVIDYSLPSDQSRLWVLDLVQHKVLYHSLVAHGKYSGTLYSKYFSDTPGSLESSIGVYLTKGTYYGRDGYSLMLRGLDKGFNDNAEIRHIVMHGAWYVSPSIIQQHGRIGRSWGCPALNPEKVKPIIDTIKGGTILVAYYPDKRWLEHSEFLHRT